MHFTVSEQLSMEKIINICQWRKSDNQWLNYHLQKQDMRLFTILSQIFC